MTQSFRPLLVGGLTLLLFSLNTVWWCSVLYLFVLVKWIVPHKGFRRHISRILIVIANVWIEGNSFIFSIIHKVRWDLRGVENLSTAHSYLVVSNHISWADIFVLQHIFKRRIPFLKFFLKQELIWVPLLGIAWWALDFPFLKRYSRHFLEKHPEMRGKDVAATRKSCEKFKDYPVSVMNFLEGTRFTYQKHAKQNSPYEHLLVPRAGGVALVFSSMGDYLSSVLDVTIVYPENVPPVHFWDLLSGKVPHITVHVAVLPIPGNVVGRSYEEDAGFRNEIQKWVNGLWRAKDRRIAAIKAGGELSAEANEAP
ncbi:acyltransferase [Desulfatitalea tepidiphila]|uniref:acyltransferase n=1 Tax=Desulfatitalea tepidiphila TaxID=1185843 RepID=UPI0006B44473|nr:acyltransferase [Desulfatitalea tepidiphila]